VITYSKEQELKTKSLERLQNIQEKQLKDQKDKQESEKKVEKQKQLKDIFLSNLQQSYHKRIHSKEDPRILQKDWQVKQDHIKQKLVLFESEQLKAVRKEKKRVQQEKVRLVLDA